MAESARIEELRRRVQMDPASIAFAALAEEYRRAGRFEEAVATCQAGLLRHPAYMSARVTLGRALLEMGQFDEARAELEHVLRVSPENLAAIRGLAEIHHRAGETASEEGGEEGGEDAAGQPPEPAPPAADPDAPIRLSTLAPAPEPAPSPPAPAPPAPPHPELAALPELEHLLASLERMRAEQAAAPKAAKAPKASNDRADRER